MELLQIKCPTCHSAALQSHTTYTTQYHGRRIIYKCTDCPTYFSETKKTLMAGLKTPVSVIWPVLKARTGKRKRGSASIQRAPLAERAPAAMMELVASFEESPHCSPWL